MSTRTTKDRDVIIVGGGPAGSTAASLLARAGLDVLLLERDTFPRDHVGESMLPHCHRLFADLGVLPRLEKTFVRKPGVRFIDKTGASSTTWCFSHTIKDDTYLSFQVNRADFDQILLENARRLGAEVREAVKVVDVDLGDPKAVVVTAQPASGERETHRARFVIDASGRDALIGTKKGTRKPREELDRTAIWSHWTGVKMAGGLEEGLSIIIYIGEEKKGWIWVFPLGPDRITAGVVMQNAYMREQKAILERGGSTDWKKDLCYQELRQAPLVVALLEGATQALPMLTNGDYSYEVKDHYGVNYAMIGDARGFIDPIFSSGVYLSMKTAYLVSSAVQKRLSGEVGAADAEMKAAYDTVTGAYAFVHRMIRLFYNPHALSWADIGVEGEVHRRHESAMAAGHFMLAGDFFEAQERYHGFFDMLENPREFKRYKELVIDRKGLSDTTCGVPWDLAFSAFK